MVGKRKEKVDGVVQIILLSRVEVWIINIKQDNVERLTQEIINKAGHLLHVHHRIHQRVVLQQIIYDQGLRGQVEEAAEGEEEVVVVGVKVLRSARFQFIE